MSIVRIAAAVGLMLAISGSSTAQYLYPESCEFDQTRNRWLISNQGNNQITALDSQGQTSVFSTLTAPRGLAISGDTLFAVSASLGLAAYNLATGHRHFLHAFAGAVQLNDVAVDSSGNAYVSDWQGHKIYRLRLAPQSSSVIATGLNLVNGLMYDHPNHRLLACHYANNSPISAVSLTDFSVAVAASPGFNLLDGITQDNEGRIYFSSHGSGAVYRLPADLSGTPEPVRTGLSGPGDIYYHKGTDILGVPEIQIHRVSFFWLYDGDGDGIFAYLDNCPYHYNPDQVDSDDDGVGDACCCVSRVGDADDSGDDEPTIGDVSTLIDAKFISGICEGIIDCPGEADVNQSGGIGATCDDITIGDITMLIDYLFITGSSLGLPDCQ